MRAFALLISISTSIRWMVKPFAFQHYVFDPMWMGHIPVLFEDDPHEPNMRHFNYSNPFQLFAINLHDSDECFMTLWPTVVAVSCHHGRVEPKYTMNFSDFIRISRAHATMIEHNICTINCVCVRCVLATYRILAPHWWVLCCAHVTIVII